MSTKKSMIVAVASVAGFAASAAAQGFSGGYGLEQWQAKMIDGAAAETDLEPAIHFEYDWDGGIVLDQSTIEYSAIATATETFSFAYHFRGTHRFFNAQHRLRMFVEDENGRTYTALVPNTTQSGTFNYQGRASLEIKEGFAFGFEIRGQNGDSNGSGQGNLILHETSTGLDTDYALENWTITDLPGTTIVSTPTINSALELRYRSDIDSLPLSGVTCDGTTIFGPATTEATAFAFGNGDARFRWTLSYAHQFFADYVQLNAITGSGPDRQSSEIVTRCETGGSGVNRQFAQGVTDVQTVLGEPFGVELIAGNFNGGAAVAGSLVLWRFDGPIGDENVCIADVTTTNTNPGDADYSVPDGGVDVSDLTFFVEAWINGCP
ncbi:MAG: hypothetical protein AAGG07_04950 [Planctomycetota bacterium]